MSTEAWRDLVITTAMILGADNPTYDDYGHPERAANRKYWTMPGDPDVDRAGIIYGYTKADVLYRWLIRRGITVTKTLETRKTR